MTIFSREGGILFADEEAAKRGEAVTVTCRFCSSEVGKFKDNDAGGALGWIKGRVYVCNESFEVEA